LFDTQHFVIREFLADGLVKEADVRRANEHAASCGGSPVESLVALGIVTSRRLAIARAKICEYPFVDLGAFDIDIHNANLIPRGVADRLIVFPLFVVDGTATVAMNDPLNLQGIDQVRQLLKSDVDPVICDTEQLRNLISRAYSLVRTEGLDSTGRSGTDDTTTGDEPIVAAVNQIIAGAVDASASDIHINPDETELHLRYRVDGGLKSQQGPARNAHAAIVQRLKVLARLDLTQTRKPQDGKFRHVHRGEAVDIRLSLIPTIHGENVVMRILRSANRIGSVKDLGMSPEMTAWYGDLIEHPHGMVLVTGPTGSGKTTTLYTALHAINTPDRNIMTIEDPVEIRLPLVRQVQANPEVGLTFAAALRSMLRQDPDVVLVGEIRDGETAKIAVQAALTGHLVFSTLHTNEAIGAIPRLKDLGVPLFAINNALLCIIAQRLVRKVCDGCSAPETAENVHAILPGVDPRPFRRGTGCAKCLNTGFKGRLGAYEMLRITPRVQKIIERDGGQTEIAAAARLDGMRSIWEDGIDKAKAGLTSVQELLKLRSISEEPPESETAAPTTAATISPAPEVRAAA
jgi:type IV pilus assembly protein PilB